MVHTADTKEQLDSDTEALLTTARKHLCQFTVLKYQQMDGLNTALPFGVRKIDTEQENEVDENQVAAEQLLLDLEGTYQELWPVVLADEYHQIWLDAGRHLCQLWKNRTK